MNEFEPLYPVFTGNIRTKLNATWYIFNNRVITYSRYKGQVIMSILMPIMLAAIPILMGSAIAGSPAKATQVFQSTTHTSAGSYQGYMLIGALLFQLVSNSLWNFGFWLRREQMTGTLESGVYLVPLGKGWLVLGSALYVVARNAVSFIIALVLGVIIFSIQINTFMNVTLLLGILFLILGIIPIIGLSLLFGAVVLKFKEVGSLIDVMQWIVSFLMGVFFPVTILPAILFVVALLFPPTWTANGIRMALYNAPAFIGVWQDLLIQFGYTLIIPFIALYWFGRVERNVLKTDGVGKY